MEYGPGLCPEAERACDQVFWLSSVNPLLERQDLQDIADAVEKVATALVEKQRAGIPIRYATSDQRARIEWRARPTPH